MKRTLFLIASFCPLLLPFAFCLPLRYIFARRLYLISRGREGRMQGVVSLLDDRHYARVEAIWEELGQKFDVRGMYVNSFPHFSFQVAEQYDEEACAQALRAL